jgi:hypothetical protein
MSDSSSAAGWRTPAAPQAGSSCCAARAETTQIASNTPKHVPAAASTAATSQPPPRLRPSTSAASASSVIGSTNALPTNPLPALKRGRPSIGLRVGRWGAQGVSSSSLAAKNPTGSSAKPSELSRTISGSARRGDSPPSG